MAKITLDNGMVIEGSVEEIKAMAEAFGVKEADELKESEPTYRLVSGRDTRVGDFVKFNRDERDITSGKYYEVIRISGNGDVVFMDDENDTRFRCPKSRYLEIYEKVTKAPAEPEPLKVGDYAKVLIGNTYVNSGDIAKIIEEDEDTLAPFRLEGLNGEYLGWKRKDPKHIRKATEEEVAEAKEAERWAKIGREVNEFKAGDIVRVNLISESAISSHLKRGEMGEVGEISDDGFRVNGRLSSVNWVEPLDVELITPVEARFDRE